MTPLVLPFSYLRWHYSRAWVELWVISRDLLWFLYHFFSIRVLSRTLLAPWRRLGESYPERFNLGAYLSTFFINGLMRLVGLVARLAVIIFGYLVILLALVLGLIIFLIWSILPLVLVTVLVLALKLILINS